MVFLVSTKSFKTPEPTNFFFSVFCPSLPAPCRVAESHRGRLVYANPMPYSHLSELRTTLSPPGGGAWKLLVLKDVTQRREQPTKKKSGLKNPDKERERKEKKMSYKSSSDPDVAPVQQRVGLYPNHASVEVFGF